MLVLCFYDAAVFFTRGRPRYFLDRLAPKKFLNLFKCPGLHTYKARTFTGEVCIFLSKLHNLGLKIFYASELQSVVMEILTGFVQVQTKHINHKMWSEGAHLGLIYSNLRSGRCYQHNHNARHLLFKTCVGILTINMYLCGMICLIKDLSNTRE